jgi:hypothetical protein
VTVPTTDQAPEGTGFSRSAVVRVTLLLAVLAAVTAAGIVAGRELKPAASPAPTVPTGTVASTAATDTITTTPARVVVVHRAKGATWGPLTVEPYGRFRAAGGRSGAAVAGKTLVVAGGTGNDQVVAGTAGRPLSAAGSLPGPRAAPQVFASRGTVYVLGGEDGETPTDQILRLNPAKGNAVPAGAFEEPLAEAGVAERGASIYLAGGWTGQKYGTAILKFTPPSTVALVARLPVGVRSPAVALLRHTLYVAGGATAAGPSKKMFAVDVDSGAVTALDDLPEPVEQAVLLVSGTKLYLLGGKSAAGKPLATILAIDPATGQATGAGRMPKPLAGAVAVPMGSKTLVVDSASGRVFRLG